MHSGRPVIATDIYTHNQLLTSDVVYLAQPHPKEFAKGIINLAKDPGLRANLAKKGKEFVEKNHTFHAHKIRLNNAYDYVEEMMKVF